MRYFCCMKLSAKDIKTIADYFRDKPVLRVFYEV